MNKKDIKIIFMGTPKIASDTLHALIEDGFNVVAVITQPDKESGRGKLLNYSPVKQEAIKNNIKVYQPNKIRNDYEFVKDINPDIIITFSYGQILPQGLLDIPRFGCLNLHGSILPKYRGASPIQSALINGDKITGMTLMKMSIGMDEGDIVKIEEIKIEDDDNASTLFDKMGKGAIKLIKENLLDYCEGKITPIKQDDSEATYCKLIKHEQEKLDLSLDIYKFVGWIKGLSLTPGGYLYLGDKKIKILDASVYDKTVFYPVGMIIQADKNGLIMQGSNGTIKINTLQLEGKKMMDYRSFINGHPNLKNRYFQ